MWFRAVLEAVFETTMCVAGLIEPPPLSNFFFCLFKKRTLCLFSRTITGMIDLLGVNIYAVHHAVVWYGAVWLVLEKREERGGGGSAVPGKFGSGCGEKAQLAGLGVTTRGGA